MYHVEWKRRVGFFVGTSTCMALEATAGISDQTVRVDHCFIQRTGMRLPSTRTK